MSKAELAQYRDDGYFVARGLVSNRLIERVYEMTVALFRKYFSDRLRLTQQDLNDRGPHFHSLFVRARQEDPESFGLMYETAHTGVALHEIFLDPAVLETVANLLGEASHGLSVTGQVVRMDAPGDRRNVLDWHQESSYSFLNRSGDNGLVCWIPMQDVTHRNGTIQVCPGSHLGGWLQPIRNAKHGATASETRGIPEETLKKYTQVSVEAMKGDAVFFNMDLFHKSGSNHSEGVRFTARSRYHRMLTPDFVPHRPQWIPNQGVKNRVFGHTEDAGEHA